jgi:transposase
MYRFDLTDAQWERIASFFPERFHHGHAGHPWKDHRPLINGILWHLHSGAPWRDTPERYGPWQTVYDRFNRWRQDGTWTEILDALLLHLDQASGIDRAFWCFDGTISRAHVSAAGANKHPNLWPALGSSPSTQVPEPEDHALGRSQGGFSTKTHLVTDSHGIIQGVWVTAGQRHEIKGFAAAMQRAQRPRQAGRPRWPKQGLGDKGYSYSFVRRWLQRHHIKAVIPTRKNQPREENFDKVIYRRRNIIERAVGWFKWCRALATRYDKLAVNYLALWIIANIQYLLRKYPEALGVSLSDTT